MLGTREVFRCGTMFELGEGRGIDFWRDKWRGSSPLCSQFPSVFSEVVNKSCRVSECFGGRGWRWRKILKGIAPRSQRECPTIREFKSSLANIRPVTG